MALTTVSAKAAVRVQEDLPYFARQIAMDTFSALDEGAVMVARRTETLFLAGRLGFDVRLHGEQEFQAPAVRLRQESEPNWWKPSSGGRVS